MAGFDVKAENYDQEFTRSLVGTIQRKQVHQQLEEILRGKTDLKILELNCGTGEDIGFLKRFGEVTGTDISEPMLKIARKKNPETEFFILDFNTEFKSDKKYDLVFSNFGGLNCVSKERLSQLNNELSNLLNPNGMLIIVLISKWSLMEFLYFSFRLNFKKAFRRLNGKAYFNELPIYYYSHPETRYTFQSFTLQSIKAIGKYYTGEYMNKWGSKLNIHEPKVEEPGLLLGADHILFNFIKR